MGAIGATPGGATPEVDSSGPEVDRAQAGHPLGRYGDERLAEGPPWPPLGFIPVYAASKFTDNLGLIACKLITLFLYSSM